MLLPVIHKLQTNHILKYVTNTCITIARKKYWETLIFTEVIKNNVTLNVPKMLVTDITRSELVLV